jgi:hypothetical protein
MTNLFLFISRIKSFIGELDLFRGRRPDRQQLAFRALHPWFLSLPFSSVMVQTAFRACRCGVN